MINKAFYLVTLFLFFTTTFSQNLPSKQIIIENEKGNIITNSEEKNLFISKIIAKKDFEKSQLLKTNQTQTPVELCTNGGFEQYETVSGSQKLKNFLYTIGDPPGPTQCRSITNTADSYIDIYDPNNTSVMATTVPANLIDPYIGDINAFDQYVLKINYSNSNTYGSIVQGERFKTNNENLLKFNYKAVLMTVYDSGHTDNQPFIKARIINSSGIVVDEFCLVGDETNCIFTKIPGSDAAILYTSNWQSGLLDISSIPNNETFTVELMASRCGFGGHFGYMYVDDICLLQSNENFQGSIELNPLNKVCPTLPVNVCGTYTIPNSGGITATLGTLTLNLYNNSGTSIYNTSIPSTLDTINHQFCFTLNAANFPNTLNANYNVGVTATYNVSGSGGCGGTVFNSASDPDSNSGWDISFQNCSPSCNFNVTTTTLSLCDSNHDGSELFNLTNANASIVTSTTGLSFSYFTTYNDANANTNSISNTTSYNSSSKTVYVRVSQDASCFKIITITLEVRNPNVNISGILNVCSGSTVLTATSGSNYLWSTGATTQSITATTTGNYSVAVTDASGCSNTASVSIEPTQTATTPNVIITQPSCFTTIGSIQITSTASQYSFDNGNTWTTSSTINNLSSGTYQVKIKTINNCTSYPLSVTIFEALTSYPNFTFTNPSFCGDVGRITITTVASSYSFDDGITWTTNPVAINLTPGTYMIRIKDAQGCISNFNTVLLSSATLEAPIFTIINPACGVNGSITINTISDFYTFDGGTTWVSSNILTNITSGSYSVAIKNNLGCTSDYSYAYINDLQDIYPATSFVQPICGAGGSIAITTIAAYYSFDDGVTWTTNNIVTNLAPGTYFVKVKNAAGCISLSNYVNLNIPYIDYPLLQTIQPLCGTNGTITINTLSDFYSFDDGITWVTNNAMSLPPGYYSIVIKNNLGCISNSNYASLDIPVLPIPSYTIVQPNCSNTGSITITTSAAFYSIDGGSTWVTNPVFNNLTGGTYYFKIKNSLGCLSDFNYVNLDTNYLANPSYTYINPSCGNIGKITFTSNADFYSIDGGITWSTSPVFSNLISGYYSIQVKNIAGCISSQYGLYLNSTNLAVPNVTVIQPCNGNNGSITITTTAAYYSIDGGTTWSTSPVFSNLSYGNYYIMIKDNAGCESSNNYIYLDSALPSPNVTVIQPLCGTNGSITVNTSASFYSINGGTSWVTNPVFTNLAPGYYDVSIKNSAGCISYTQYINLQQPFIANPNYTITQPTCGVGGIITITTPATLYSVNAGLTWQSTPIFSNLSSGGYNIVIKNSLGCVSYDIYVQIETYYLPNPNITIVQPSCGNNGSITIATSASQYSFDGGSTWSINPVLSNLTSGYYDIMIKNSLGCTSNPYVMNVSIHSFYLPTPLVTFTQPSCSNAGDISILTTADFYSFDNGTTWITNPVLLNPTSGSYDIKIKNNLGCVSESQYIYINAYYLPAPTLTLTQPSCTTVTGTIKINTPADEYSFDNGVTWVTNSILSNVLPGSYNVKIKNSLGCISSYAYAYIYSPPFSPNAPLINVTQPSSCGTTDGSITITTSASEYSYNNGVSWTTNPTKINLAAGTYYIKYRNGTTQCESIATVITLNSGTTITAPSYTVINPGCSVLFGSITITTTASYFSFDDGITFTSSNTKSNLVPGTYYVKIKNAAGCISNSNTATIVSSANLPSPTYTVSQPDCTTLTGIITITTTSSLYSFDNGTTYSSLNTQNNLIAGTYSIKIKDAAGCESTSLTVTIGSQPTTPAAPSITIAQPLNCTTTTGNITITSPAAYYSFDNGSTWGTNNTSIPFPAGTYLIKIKQSATGCESLSTPAIINAPPNAPATPTYATVQPTTCANALGSISITSSEYNYSFDNGVNYSTNPNSTLLPAGTYLIKVKNSSNCESLAVSVTINPPTDYPPVPTYSIALPDCNNPNGTITITTSASEYSFDNGTTWSFNPTSSSLISGNYALKIKNNIGCISNATIATIIPFTNFTIPPTVISPQTFCIQNPSFISSISITGQNIKWYDTAIGGNVLPIATILTNGTTYFASQTINSCESLRVPILISIQNTPEPTGAANQIRCSNTNPTLNNISISGTAINWYATNSSTTVLPYTTVLINGANYFATQTINGCESVNRLAVNVTLITTLNANDYSQSFCDDLNDGNENVVLSVYNTNLIASTSGITFSYYTSFASAENQIVANELNPNYILFLGLHIIYVRLDSTNGCHQVVELNLSLFPKPIILIDDLTPICSGKTIIVDAGSGFNSYNWSTGAISQRINISTPGTYTVTVTKNYGLQICSSTKTFTVVLSQVATITSITTEDWTDIENVIIVSTVINDNYLFSLDGINYQTSNTFSGLSSGFYTVYVKDECGIVKEDVVLLNYPKFFTPNNDGFNDLWRIKFSRVEPNLTVFILDRYGKLITTLESNSPGWDGTYNGEQLPSNDYWFEVHRENGNIHRGHFAMKR
jgi:gliding motility-associated-like protein